MFCRGGSLLTHPTPHRLEMQPVDPASLLGVRGPVATVSSEGGLGCAPLVGWCAGPIGTALHRSRGLQRRTRGSGHIGLFLGGPRPHDGPHPSCPLHRWAWTTFSEVGGPSLGFVPSWPQWSGVAGALFEPPAPTL